MTRGFSLIRLIVVGSVDRSTSLLNKMLKRSAQSPPERKSKIQDSLASVKSYSTDQSNLKSDLSQPDITSEMECAASDDKHCQVEYLETPVKSENDKKQYRLDENNIIYMCILIIFLLLIFLS